MRAGDVLRSLAFYVAFYGGTAVCVLLAFAAMPFGQEAMLRMCERWSKYHRFCVTRILSIRVHVDGHLPEEGVLFAIRHEAFFEAIDLPTLLNRPAIFAKVELLRIPLWGKLGSAYGLIAVERDKGASALRKMIAAAKRYEAQGRVLAIFPEGTRIEHGSMGQIQSGFAGIYKLLGRPVVPVAVDSGPLYHRIWKRKGTITYRVGETIPPGLARAEVEARVDAAINALNTLPDA